MICTGVVGVLLGVPVPDIGPMPEQYQSSVLVNVLLGASGLAAVVFVGLVLTSRRRESSVRAVWSPVIPVVVVLLGGAVGGATLYHVQEQQRKEERYAHNRLESELLPGVQADLETAYDMTINDPMMLPVSPGDVGYVDIIDSEGAALECRVTTEEVYVFMCGEDVARSELTELPLAGS